jgi:ABC-type transport system involved in cytochrome c biogenesis permease subunit
MVKYYTFCDGELQIVYEGTPDTMLTVYVSLACYLLGLWRRAFLPVGLVFQSLYIISRGLDLGRLPLVGPHDTLIFLSASLVAFSLPFTLVIESRTAFFRGIALTAAVFTLSGLTAKAHNIPLPPVLKTIWFELHVVLAFLSYALFGIGAITGALQVSKKDALLEKLQYRAILIGYCLFSLSMIFGGIWAYLAWGTYWLWTPKEIWTSLVWLFYSLYLHVRLLHGSTGRLSPALGIGGFVVVIFTYLGVSLLMKSSHTF